MPYSVLPFTAALSPNPCTDLGEIISTSHSLLCKAAFYKCSSRHFYGVNLERFRPENKQNNMINHLLDQRRRTVHRNGVGGKHRRRGIPHSLPTPLPTSRCTPATGTSPALLERNFQAS
ncbi:hypothetical protein Bbelb_015260 [Branchiostoma belcheri]|nr:hypothetical protein Bbelb_015260 [Branchiostoma belcheri]